MRLADGTETVDLPVNVQAAVGPRCSVIIAAHNAAPYIKKAIDSARAQTENDIEIIVVDDGSRDDTALVAQAFSTNDERVIVIRLPENRGVSAARNAGLAVARGTWMAVLDADDDYAPERLSVMLDYAERHGADMVADNLEMHDFETGAPLGKAFPDEWMNPGHEIDMKYIFERDIPGLYDREIGFYKPVIRRELLTRHGIAYDEEIFAAEDFLLYAECLLAGGRMRFMPDALYRYAMRRGSLSSAKNANESLKKVSEILLRRFGKKHPTETDLLRLRLHATNYELFLWHVKERRFWLALRASFHMPPGFLLQRLSAFGLRRLGRPVENPTSASLAEIRRRNQQVSAG
jgi:glycosyltransferase involved in cell wall biosynthesis